jgi:hypothetical protein
MENLVEYKMILIFALIGAVGGFAYYFFVGCESGTCAITSNPVNSTLYGSFMGGLLGDSFRKKSAE